MLILRLILLRKRISIFSAEGFKYCAKRVWTLNRLLSVTLRELKLKYSGSKIGELTVVESIKVQGPASNLVVGGRSFIGEGTFIATHEKVEIGANVVINANVKIYTAEHDVDCENWSVKSKAVIIEDYVWIASNATILPGTTLKRGAVVGAGAVVNSVVQEKTVVVGNPGKAIKTRKINEFKHNPVKFCPIVEAWLGK